jgi:hypothetical protein
MIGVLTTSSETVAELGLIADEMNSYVILSDNAALATIVTSFDLWVEKAVKGKRDVQYHFILPSKASRPSPIAISRDTSKQNWVMINVNLVEDWSDNGKR